jgi:diacylglycerol O-acyltransferase
MSERMSGSDAALLHLEDPETHGHTLKVVVLDTTRRGQPVSLEEMAAGIEPRLGLIARSTQRVVAARGFGGIPFWVDDPDFRLSHHLDEVVAGPGGLDAECSRAASEQLPRDRPLWSMRLVHGLPDRRQAVIVRVHHAITDGFAAVNALLACTTDEPGGKPPSVAPAPGERVDDDELRRAARASTRRLVTELPGLLRDAAGSARRARRFRRTHPDLPKYRQVHRSSLHPPSTRARRCASASLPLEPIRQIARTRGVTVNGVFHSLVAGAMRAELLERDDLPDGPAVATFGIAVDTSDRRYGNFVTPTGVALAVDLEDPLRRLDETAKSCIEGVELRWATGLEMFGRWAAYGPRLMSVIRRVTDDRIRTVPTHITTANVRGPASTRWLGDVEVVDWLSYSITMSPCQLSLTAYSYGDRLNLGLVVVPEAMPHPEHFLQRIADELDLLARLVLGSQALLTA